MLYFLVFLAGAGSGIIKSGAVPAERVLVYRTANVSHYLNPDGTVTAVIAACPVTEEQLWPEYLNWWTGFVQHDRLNNTYARSDNLIKLEYLYTHTIEEKVRSGWMKFNTSSIPDGSRILSASLRYLVCYFEMTVELQVTALAIDPVTASSQELFHAIEDGAECAYRTIGRIYDTTDLNASGVAHVQNTLEQNWVAFGLRGGNFRGILTRKAWITGWNTTPPSDRPHLAVTYQPPQALFEQSTPNRTTADQALTALVTRGMLELSPRRAAQRTLLFDTNGRPVMRLHTGMNDVRHLPSGVYFIHQETAAGTPDWQLGRKIIILNQNRIGQ